MLATVRPLWGESKQAHSLPSWPHDRILKIIKAPSVYSDLGVYTHFMFMTFKGKTDAEEPLKRSLIQRSRLMAQNVWRLPLRGQTSAWVFKWKYHTVLATTGSLPRSARPKFSVCVLLCCTVDKDNVSFLTQTTARNCNHSWFRETNKKKTPGPNCCSDHLKHIYRRWQPEEAKSKSHKFSIY